MLNYKPQDAIVAAVYVQQTLGRALVTVPLINLLMTVLQRATVPRAAFEQVTAGYASRANVKLVRVIEHTSATLAYSRLTSVTTYAHAYQGSLSTLKQAYAKEHLGYSSI